MMSPPDSFLPPPPQIGCAAPAPDHPEDHTGLWSQLLAVFRDLGGSFDPFANDANAQVRALGRIARQRRPPGADDYFALGDLCARLTLQDDRLSETYAAKTIAAYLHGTEIGPTRVGVARRATLAFALWVAEVARLLGDYESLKIGLLVCERVEQIGFVAQSRADTARLRATAERLREWIVRLDDHGPTAGDRVASERESRLLCDQGQMLLRQSQPADALAIFEHALLIDDQNHTVWLWHAMALTDLGRFDDALASYDRALALEPESARVWNSKGALLMELGRVEPALGCFSRALELPVASAAVKAAFWLNEGKALFKLGRYHEAHEALVYSHQLDPSAESAAGIAACRERLDDRQAAEAA